MLNILKKIGLVILLISPACLYLYIVSPDSSAPAETSTEITQPTAATSPSTPDH